MLWLPMVPIKGGLDCLPLNKRFPALYIFSETEDNQLSPVEQAIVCWSRNAGEKIVCLNTVAGRNGSAGFEFQKYELIWHKVPEAAIIPLEVPPEPFMVHTRSEAELLVRYARAHQWGSVIVCAASFHQVRAFASVVTIALREYPTLRIYSAPGTPLNWKNRVRHSQGALQNERKALIQEEYNRLVKYHKKGDLASNDEILNYLDWRDSVRA